MLATVFITTELFLKSTKNENHKVQETKCFSDVQVRQQWSWGMSFNMLSLAMCIPAVKQKDSAVTYRHAQLLFGKRTVGSVGMSTGPTLIQGIIYHFVKGLLCH